MVVRRKEKESFVVKNVKLTFQEPITVPDLIRVGPEDCEDFNRELDRFAKTMGFESQNSLFAPVRPSNENAEQIVENQKWLEFLVEHDFVSVEEERLFVATGQIFKVEGELCILAYLGGGRVKLISVKDGNRLTDEEPTVKSMNRITLEEFAEALGATDLTYAKEIVEDSRKAGYSLVW